ncbi:FscB [Pararhodobacter sp. SW119]|uniref:FscB n=1 Tax=Pararhodobacter sp. SW119 TaxID=2780075 RepID=UPI001AE00513|nr:FscB [Pararhodobacter sp. SW119]
MTHILHLGHQPTDLSGVTGLLSTDAAGFDATLDVNCIRISTHRDNAVPLGIGFPAPAGDLWLGFRYVPPNADASSIIASAASFLEVFDADHVMVARVKPLAATNRYHAEAHGDTTVQGGSSYTAAAGQPSWVNVRVAVGADITIEFYIEGVLHSSATAANTGSKGKPRLIVFSNLGLHAMTSVRTWYYAHIAVLDGVSTIGRRFVRRRPNAIASYNQMVGSLAALADGNIATRVASAAAGQRMSFSLTGPAVPAGAIAGVHLKQIAQAGTIGPQATAGFLRLGGVDHDAAPVTVPSLMPKGVYSSWAVNPADASPWTDLTLPAEVGIVSA